jgi:hypothetical protein
MRRLLPLVLFVNLAAFLAPCEQAHADVKLIMNGDFSQAGNPPDAFASWTTTFGDRPTDGGGFATFTESATSAFVELEQTFAIPVNSHISSLSFEFKAVSDTTSGEPSGGNPDSFQATLFDSASNPFPNSSNPPFPAFYSMDIGGQQFFDPNFVSVSPAGNPGWSRVTLNLSTLALPQAAANIQFVLNGSDDGQSSVVYLDNVETQSMQVVPEPSTLIPVGLGLIGLIAYGCRSRTSRLQCEEFTSRADAGAGSGQALG